MEVEYLFYAIVLGWTLYHILKHYDPYKNHGFASTARKVVK